MFDLLSEYKDRDLICQKKTMKRCFVHEKAGKTQWLNENKERSMLLMEKSVSLFSSEFTCCWAEMNVVLSLREKNRGFRAPSLALHFGPKG